MIENLLLYIAKVALGSTVMLGIYFLFYRKETFHRRNRIFLNLSMVLPLLIPLVNIGSFFKNTNTLSSVEYGSRASVVESSYYIESAISSTIDRISFSEGLFYIYIIGLAVSIVAIFWGIYSIISIIRRGEKIESNGTTITLSASHLPPFSFFKNIVISEDVYTENDYPSIISHELAHIGQKHYLDLMFCEFFVALQWFNPAAWFLRKAIKENHEFLADDEVVNQCKSIKQYQISLLGVSGIGKAYPLAHNFNKRIIKKRIIMMNRAKTNRFARLKNFFIVPAIAILLLTITSSNIPSDILQRNIELSPVFSSSTSTSDQIDNKLTTDPGSVISNLILQDTVIFSETSLRILRGVLYKSIMYPKEAIQQNYENDIYLVLKVRDGNVLSAGVFNSPDDFNTPVIGTVAIGAFETDEKADTEMQDNQKLLNLLYSETVEGAKKFEGLDIPEWKDKTVEFALKLEYSLGSSSDKDRVFVVVQNMPEFQGGDLDKFREWVQEQATIPETIVSKGIEGKVYVMFVVDKDGSVSDASIMRGLHPELDKIALDIVNSSPKWTTGHLNSDDPVKVRYSITVNFQIPR